MRAPTSQDNLWVAAGKEQPLFTNKQDITDIKLR